MLIKIISFTFKKNW